MPLTPTPRNRRRLSRKNGSRLIRMGWNDFEDITQESKERLPHLVGNKHFPERAWKNNIYIVQTQRHFLSDGTVALKAMIRRNDEKPVHSWRDMQRIKNEIFGEEFTAIEVYPKQSRLVDVANIYWLWILPMDYDLPFELGHRTPQE